MPSDLMAAIETISTNLEKIDREFVFIGGAVVELYLSKDYSKPMRPTDDIDCIVKLPSKLEQHRLEKQLRARNFSNDTSMICRWHFDHIVVDIMPTNGHILGFSNSWYEEGMIIESYTDFLPAATFSSC